VNPSINAVTVDLREPALPGARHAGEAVARGGGLPPLLGVRFTIKENIDVAGTATTQGACRCGSLLRTAFDQRRGRLSGWLNQLADNVRHRVPSQPCPFSARLGAERLLAFPVGPAQRGPAWRSISRLISASETGLFRKTSKASAARNSTHAMAG